MAEPTTRPTTPPAIPEGLPRPGDVLAGKYRIEAILGMGGMGVVVAATHLELDETVAIKFLLPSAAPNPDATARFVREARAAIKIKSDHVVRVLDVGRLVGGSPYIVMEYLRGRDLAALVDQDGPLPVADAVAYVLQACEAIAAAHALGIVHRDLKPANLFLTRAGDGSPRVKVLDFGISKMQGEGLPAGDVTTTATIMGTPCYMSPEQLRSTKDVDARADIWALGTIAYALLTGAPPYYAETTADVAAKIIRDAPPALRAARADAPEGLEAVIAKCLAKEREDRYPDVGALAEALAPFGAVDAHAAATRVRRVITHDVATAPTMLSDRAPIPAASSAPTRTASAWGDTKPGPAPKRRSWIFAGAAILSSAALAATLALALPHRAPLAPAAAPPAPTDLPPTPNPTPLATPTPTPNPNPTPTPTPIRTPIPTPTPKPTPPPLVTPKPPPPPPPKPLKPASAAPSAKPAPSSGLFDDRE